MEYLPIAEDGAPIPIRALVIADDPLARGGLAALAGASDAVSSVGQGSSYDDVLSLAEICHADVVLWDLAQADPDIIERLADLSLSLSPVVALLDDVALSAQVWSSGVRAILHRDVSLDLLGAALRAAVDGAVVLDDGFAEALVRRAGPSPPLRDPLTPREVQVLRLLAEGHANKNIAGQLDVSENTVKFHVNALLSKLGAQSRTEAVTRAVRQGLIPL